MTKDTNQGRRLSNRYQLVEMVGKGAMGRVYLAEDNLLGGVAVAVKFLSQALLNKKMKERFLREAKISALLAEKTIHIVRVRDYGVDEDEIPFYVMEFLQGDSISELIKVQPFTLPRFLKLARQICLGLQPAHQGIIFDKEQVQIIHRDIKPSNVLVVQDSTLGELVKILDFGIAKLIQSGGAQTQSFMGTLAYCSPEQMEGKELDNRSDIYSLGIMMYEMLTGDMPITPETHSFGGWYKAHHHNTPKPFKTNVKIPSALGELILSCLAKDPRKRPQTVGDILQSLEPLEKRFSNNLKLGQRIDATLSGVKIETPLSPEDICLRTNWPEDKPNKKIVFPRLIRTESEVLVTLWVMLEQQDINNRLFSTRYNQFLCLMAPHPMLLWISVLYNHNYGPRWLRCYLDLKTANGQKIARLLGKAGHYRILFFALEDYQHCKRVMKFTIDPNQCQRLIDWANASHTVRSAAQPNISRQALQKEFERFKPKIQLKLESIQTNPNL